MDVEKREKERERGSNLRRQRQTSPTAQVLVAQTTRAVQRIGFVTSFRATFRLTRSTGVGRREKEGKETSGRGSQDEPAEDKEQNSR